MSKHIKRIFIFILGCLLFSCDTVQKNDKNMNLLKLMAVVNQNPVPVIAEYGMPYARYTISGNVSDEVAKPIPGIQVYFCNMATYSDKGGDWYMDFHTFNNCPEPLTLKANDVDGNENGSFDDQEILLNLVQTEPDNKWFQGRFEQNGISIILKP